MDRSRGTLITLLAIGGLLTAGTSVATGSPPSRTSSAAETISSDLDAVAAVPGTGTFYAVGGSETSGGGSLPILIVRGRPGQWRPVSATTPDASFLTGVTAPTASSVWAVGGYDTVSDDGIAPLILHSSGGAFSRQSAPRLPHTTLDAVDGVGAHDAWAVGEQQSASSSAIHPVALRWRGSRWREVALSLPHQIQRMKSITVTGAKDAWAVGAWYAHNSPNPHAALLHWNGRKWSVARAPHGNHYAVLDVDASTRKHAIATGFYYAHGQPARYFASWNGHKWTQQHPKGVSRFDTGAVDLFGTSGWAVSETVNFGIGDPHHPLIVRWTGKAWKPVSAPHHGKFSSLVAVAVGSSRRAAAVGSYDPDGSSSVSHAIAFTYNGRRWTEDHVPESSPNNS